jgi:hypothetical protein
MARDMEFDKDHILLREGLESDPPLHMRRTLDQYFYPKLENTSLRDTNQVVYRETRSGKYFRYRTTRVVMVDQLWLWILDNSKRSIYL